MENIKEKIIVVDDDQEVLDIVGNILERHDFEVLRTTSGRESLRLIREHYPKLIILDIDIPDLSGNKIASVLSLHADTASIPILFLTGLISQEEQGLKPGGNYLMAKPVTVESLLTFVRSALGRKER